jgi:hypothetical protein
MCRLAFLWVPIVTSVTLLFSSPASALPSGVPFAAFLDAQFVGTLEFQLDSWITVGACRYVAAINPGEGVPDELCVLDEATRFGFFGCVANAEEPVLGLVVLTPGQFCQLYDGNGQDNLVFMMLLGENTDGSLDGIVQFSAATNTLASFHAAPIPKLNK